MTRILSTLALGAASVLALSLVNGGSAEAGRGGGGGHFSGGGGFHGGASFHGSVHVGGGFHGGAAVHGSVGFRGGYHSTYRGGYRSARGYGGRGYRGGYYGGHIWVGGCWGCGPYNYGYYPEYVPSYYGTTYYPVSGQPTYAAQVAAIRPELPRFGIGLAAGGVSTSNPDGSSTHDSDDVAFLGRLRLTPGLIVEGELGKTTYDNDSRVDRRLGASLIYEIGAYNKLAPYVLVGGGVQQADVNGNYNTDQSFAEIGVGLRYAITPHFHIAADIRAGSRSSISNDQVPVLTTAERTLAPPTSDSGQNEDYTRGRLSAILYF
nr:outer membrane beta-barrel protein [Kofleriaceae bacterium]